VTIATSLPESSRRTGTFCGTFTTAETQYKSRPHPKRASPESALRCSPCALKPLSARWARLRKLSPQEFGQIIPKVSPAEAKPLIWAELLTDESGSLGAL
jgi:hypothetical protein